jgi:hypothetical protein
MTIRLRCKARQTSISPGQLKHWSFLCTCVVQIAERDIDMMGVPVCSLEHWQPTHNSHQAALLGTSHEHPSRAAQTLVAFVHVRRTFGLCGKLFQI